jgi:hypothetical protein
MYEVFRRERKPEIGSQFRREILEQFSVSPGFNRFIYSKFGKNFTNLPPGFLVALSVMSK